MQVGSTLVLMPLLLRVLGPAKFGVWGAAASLAWLSGLVDIGTGTALVTLVARSSALERTEQARRHIAGALSIGSGLAGLMFVGSLRGLNQRRGSKAGGTVPYRRSRTCYKHAAERRATMSGWRFRKAMFRAFGNWCKPCLTTAGLIAAAALTRDVRVYVAAVYLGLVLANMGSLVHLFLRHPELRPRALWMSWTAMREVAGQGALYFVLALTGGLSFLLDNVLALALLGPEASARMTIALRICLTAVGCSRSHVAAALAGVCGRRREGRPEMDSQGAVSWLGSAGWPYHCGLVRAAGLWRAAAAVVVAYEPGYRQGPAMGNFSMGARSGSGSEYLTFC